MSSRLAAVCRLAGIKQLWSHDEYLMANFLTQHGQRIPVIISITEGYSGADDLHSVSVEDVRYGAHLLVVKSSLSKLGSAR